MERRVGPLRAEVTQGEGRKFTAPLLLVHGLWDTAAVWRPFAGYLSHRGWTCLAVHLRGRAGAPAVENLSQHVADLRSVLAALEAPPVVVAHDLGALLALECVDALRAAILLAPLTPASSQALQRAGGPLARRFGTALGPPRGRYKGAYANQRPAVREPRALLSDVSAARPPAAGLPPEVPGLVMVGEADPVAPPEEARQLAQSLGADVEVVAGGHALPVDDGWEERVARLHRWTIHKLGAPLLALYEEAVADRESDEGR